MSDPRDIIVLCESASVGDIVGGVALANNQIPKEHRELRDALWQTLKALYSRLTEAELYAAINAKTVGELIRLHGTDPAPEPIECGEKDGVTWAVYEKPDPSDAT